MPNGLAIDKRGNVFASDSVIGAIWRYPRGGTTPAQIWMSHELLAGCAFGDAGANGIAFWKGDLYVANTARGALVRIPVSNDGVPGTPTIIAGDEDCDPTDELWSMDGIAFDVHGDVYALLVLQHKLVRIDPDRGNDDPAVGPRGRALESGEPRIRHGQRRSAEPFHRQLRRAAPRASQQPGAGSLEGGRGRTGLAPAVMKLKTSR